MSRMFRSNIYAGDCGGGEFFTMFFVIGFVSDKTLIGQVFDIFFDLLFGSGAIFVRRKALKKKRPTSSHIV